MRHLLRVPSFSRDFITITIAVCTITIIFSCAYVWQLLSTEAKKINQTLETQSVRLERTLIDTIEYTGFLMNYLNHQIAEHHADETYINNLYGTFRLNAEVNNIVPWNMFSWVNPNGMLVVNSNLGILHTPSNVTDRDYFKPARTYPGMLQLGKVTYGKLSGQVIIPAAMGAVDDQGHFLGEIIFGIQMQTLAERLEKSLLTDGISFALVDEDLQVMAESKGNFISDKTDLIKKLKKVNFAKSYAGILSSPYPWKNDVFGYYLTIPRWHYALVLAYDINVSRPIILGALTARISEFIIVAALVLSLLYFMRLRLVKPVLELASLAEHVAKSEEPVVIPHYIPYEIELLGRQIAEIQDMKKQLKSAHKSIKTSNESLERKVIQRTKSLQQALLVKNEFLNNVSHELRTPIHGIIAFTEVLHDDWDIFDDAKRREIVDDLYSSTDRLYSLLNNLLDLTKFNEGKMILNKTASNLEDVVKEVVRECKSMLEEASMSLKLVPITTDITGNFDRDRITQVVRNLYVNAIKYSATGTITISISREKNNLLFSIRDEGKGIPPEELEGIFAPFTQSSRTKTGAGGTGLGLAICQQIILAHKGKIWAENNQTSQGCVFIFMIPAK